MNNYLELYLSVKFLETIGMEYFLLFYVTEYIIIKYYLAYCEMNWNAGVEGKTRSGRWQETEDDTFFEDIKYSMN